MYDNIGLQRYREADFSSMTQEKMIVLLYEKAISDLEEAARAADAGNRLTLTQKVNHANRIVSELRNCLDHSVGGEIAANLDSIYEYVFSECLQFLVDQDPRHARDAIEVLTPLLDAWRQIPAGTGARAARDQAPNSGGPNHANGTNGNQDRTGPTEASNQSTGLLSVSA